MASIELQCNGFTATVFDNEASDDPEVRDGQNGIRVWRQDDDPDTRLCAPSWLNLEHVIINEEEGFLGGKGEPGFFEQRNVPLTLEGDKSRARLSHGPLPNTGLAGWVEYRPGDRPGSLDFEIGFTPTQKAGDGESIGVFLPCYIFKPISRSIHFIGVTRVNSKNRKWVEYCSSSHTSVLNFAGEKTDHPPAFENRGLPKEVSVARWSYPFIWGRIGRNDFTLMLEPGDLEARFWMSPEGGMWLPDTNVSNPAWDFVVLKYSYELNKEYRAKGRIVIRPMADRSEAVDEYEAWSGRTVEWESPQ